MQLAQLDTRQLKTTQLGAPVWRSPGSLRRLGVDAIDLYQIHWPDHDPDIEEVVGGGRAEAAGARSPHRRLQLRRGPAAADSGDRTGRDAAAAVLADRVEDEILPFTRNRGIGVIVYSPMGSGLLTGTMTRERIASLPADDWRTRDPRFAEPQLSRHLALVERLQSIATRHDTTPGTVAAARALRHPAVDGAIIGFRRPDQVDAILDAGRLELSDADLAYLHDASQRGVAA